jgi:DNA-binding transcriptional LysR family regulator
MKDWSDLRVLAAIVRQGSLAGAGRSLGTHHVTVGRRLSVLERELGVKLVDRLPRSAVPTADGVEIAKLAEQMEDLVSKIVRCSRGKRRAVSGTVSISAPPVAATEIIAPGLASLLAAEPELRIVLRSSAGLAALARGEADIAVRLVEPDQPGMIARRVARTHLGLYARSAVASAPREGWRFIGYDEALAHVPHNLWFEAMVGDRPVVLRSSDIYTQLAAARAGVGIAMLPTMLADACSDLVKIEGLEPPSRDAWLVVHPDLRKSQAVRIVLDHLAQILAGGGIRNDPLTNNKR